MKILVYLTGGTIGSRVDGATVHADPASASRLLTLYQERYGTDTQFVVRQPCNLLSENATPGLWALLEHSIRQERLSAYDGVIVTHGSDTLPYTCAALAFLLRDVPVPLVLVASNYSLGNSRSNGLANFRSAVELIASRSVRGVFAVFQDEKGLNRIYLASRLQEADTARDQFSSYGGVDFGEIRDGRFYWNAHPLNPTLKEVNQLPARLLHADWAFQKPVLALRPYPGLDYRFLRFDPPPRAMLHYLYHAATACTQGEGYALPDFLRECRSRGTDCYLAPFKAEGEALYETSRALLEAGAFPLFRISFEAAYVKLTIAYNQQELAPRSLMEQCFAFEILPESKAGGRG